MAKESYYYRQYIGECPVCGRDAGYKEKVKGEKPKDESLIYIQLPQNQTYCHCLESEGM